MRRANGAALLTGVLAVLATALYLLFPLTGDDYGYMGSFRTIDGFDGPWPLERLWRWFPFHWLHANGRLANLFAMLSLTFLPKWLTALLMGAATWGMMALVLKLGGAWRGRPLAASAALAYIAVAYPWWDLMYTVDFNFNYPVAVCAGLGYVWVWRRWGCRSPLARSTRHPQEAGAEGERVGYTRHAATRQDGGRWRTHERASLRAGRWLALVFCFVAGGFHESRGAPLLAASVWLLFFNRELPKWPVAAFGTGVAVAFSSPGIWGRAAADRVADAPTVELVLCSAPLTIAAVALFGGLLLSPRWREWMSREARSWWGFWMAASVGALVFCAAGGIIGRSGWFSQTFALVALLIWGKAAGMVNYTRHAASLRSASAGMRKVMAVGLGAAAVFFTAAPIPRVAEMAEAEAAARRALEASDDGVVVAAMPVESGQPWWTLGRVRTLDADDYYLHQVIADYYKKPRFLILPPGWEGLPLTGELPDGALPIDAGRGSVGYPERFLYTAPGGEQGVYLFVPGAEGYLRVRRERDPGDV